MNKDAVAEMSQQYQVEAAQKLVPEGYKQTEVGVIPEDWVVIDFGSLVNYKKGYPFKSADYQEAGVRIIRVSDTAYSDIKNVNPIYISESDSKKYSDWTLKSQDLIFTTVGSKPPMYDSLVGKAIMVGDEHHGSLLNQNAVRIRSIANTEGIQKFLLNHFRTERYIDFIEIIFRGNANQASITLENLFEFKLPLPTSEKEQTAIANALSDTDALLSELEKLIAKKQAIKTATMQQLLTGRTRLPQFAHHPDGSKKGYKQSELGEIPEDWDVVPLGKLASIKTGSKNNQDKVADGIYPFFVRSETVERLNSYSYDCEAILVPGEGGIGSVFHYINGKFDAHQRVYVIREFVNCSGKYVYFQMRQHFGAHAMENSVKATVDSLRLPTFQEFSVFVPSLEEQTAIATILSNMDEEIQALEHRLTKTRQIKQGMMQELLTGKTRLVNGGVND